MSHGSADWERSLILSKNLFMQVLGMHSYAVRPSFASDRGVHLDAGTLALVSCFTEPNTPRAAREALGNTVEASEADFLATVDTLLQHGVLRDAGGEKGGGRTVPGSGYAHAAVHHGMLLDTARVDAYRLAIARHAPGKRVLEIGCGTGVLSIFAARYGAKEVVAIEESGAIDIARALIAENGLAENIELVAANSLDYQPEEKAEVIIHELIGHEPFAEHALRYIEDARRRLLEPGGTMIPSGIEVRCRAVGRAGWNEPRRVAAEAHELGRRYGLEVAPYVAALDSGPQLPTFERAVAPAPGGATTGDVVLYDVDFLRPISGQGVAQLVEVDLPVARGGFVNSLVVHFSAAMTDDAWLSNAPEAPRTHWAMAVYDLLEPRAVEAGETLKIRSRLVPLDGVERTLVELV